MKKRFLALLAAFTVVFSMTACDDKTENTKPEKETTEKTQKEVKGGFTVSGTKLLDAYGNEFVLRGINHAHTWFKDDLDEALEGIDETGANSVRIVLSDGSRWSKDSIESVKEIIEKCKEKELVAVLETHDGTGSDNIEVVESACNYWIEMKDALIGNEAYVILNISNEWTGSWQTQKWCDGYVSVIPKLREAGIKNTIMVDCGGWGQNAKCIREHGAEVFNADELKNTMFSIHMYGSAGKDEFTIRTGIEGGTKQELCVCVGEFGYNHSDGDVDEAYILEYCEENDIGYMAWSWKGNSGGVEYLDLAIEWDGSELSDDWGEVVINGENGIKETSEVCTVFE